MRLKNVSFATWLRSHSHKKPKERWLRELYPWPVLAQADCDGQFIGQPQRIVHDGIEYIVTLKSTQWQPAHNTHRYRLLVESQGLGWHARPFSDEFDMCGAPDGVFVTLFHAKKEEPLEKIAKAFFARRWTTLSQHAFQSLAVSRFLAASIVGLVAEQAFATETLEHYPQARLLHDGAPMFADGRRVWVGYRFFSEDAFAWARRCAPRAASVVAIYCADTKYQFRTDLPPSASVRSLAEIDAKCLGGKYEDLIGVLLRGLDVPTRPLDLAQLTSYVCGSAPPPMTAIAEADVHESLAALKRPCRTKADLRYQLAAAVVLNAWIENERRLGFVQRKSFYAFKLQVAAIVKWAVAAQLSGVRVWSEPSGVKGPILFVRIDEVDFSFHAIPNADELASSCGQHPAWTGVRLKPMAPLVLAWARALRGPDSGVPTATASQPEAALGAVPPLSGVRPS